MARRIVILGGGTVGTLTANRLRRLFDRDQALITVVDQDDRPDRSLRGNPWRFGPEKNDFIEQVQDIITVGEFYERAAGGQIIFT
jgi:hypothetical protein